MGKWVWRDKGPWLLVAAAVLQQETIGESQVVSGQIQFQGMVLAPVCNPVPEMVTNGAGKVVLTMNYSACQTASARHAIQPVVRIVATGQLVQPGKEVTLSAGQKSINILIDHP